MNERDRIMGVTRDDVVKIAGLSRLRLEEGEIDTYMRDLNAILRYIEQLNTLDVAAVQPMESVYFSPDRWKADIPVDERRGTDRLLNGPEIDGAFFVVPRVI